MMLMLFAAAQVNRLVIGILDMQADRIFVERAALAEVDDVEHGVAAANDVEGGIEDVCRNGHVVSLESLSFRGAKRTTVRNCAPENLEVPGLVLRTIPERRWVTSPISESCACRAR